MKKIRLGVMLAALSVTGASNLFSITKEKLEEMRAARGLESFASQRTRLKAARQAREDADKRRFEDRLEAEDAAERARVQGRSRAMVPAAGVGANGQRRPGLGAVRSPYAMLGVPINAPAHVVLGLDEGEDDRGAIIKAWRDLAKDYHLDAKAQRGASPADQSDARAVWDLLSDAKQELLENAR